MNALDATAALDPLASWSPWIQFADALSAAPRLPGVYAAREGTAGQLVYVGMAGERRGEGLRGRLAVYQSGKALASGLGEAVFDRALADATWVAERLIEISASQPRRATDWGRAAFVRADLHVRWAITEDRSGAVALERACLDTLRDHRLWNRRR